MRRAGRVRTLALVVAVVLAGAPTEVPAADRAVEGTLHLGERMYREGLLPSGEPMTGVVQGDVPVDGTMFSCQSCHLRSGVGSIEGTVITLPTNAGWLFRPLVGARMTDTARARLPSHLHREAFRPAYDAESLARALRSGVDPAGRELDPVMPRYVLDDEEMAVLIHYLEHLSAEPSPGVTGDTLHFATIVGEGASAAERAAMLLPLRAHIEAANAQTRHQGRRAAAGPFYKQEKYTAYRRLELSVWELKGAPETWRSQLETLYEARPVFALLGGVTGGEWWPIHEFCESNRIPALFPVTDLPVVSPSDRYTLYFSKGWYQEGEAVARHLRGRRPLDAELPSDRPVVQVLRRDPAAEALARGFRETRAALGQPEALEWVLGPDEVPDAAFWRTLAGRHPGAVLVLWLRARDLAGLEVLAEGVGAGEGEASLFLSGRLLEKALGTLPEAVRRFALVTYPYTLPGGKPRADLVTRRWLESKGIAVGDERTRSKMYLLGWMLSAAIKKMRHDLYRDHFLDVMDMMRDQYYSVAAYPRLSFGPGQRYASKGCYLVRVGPGPKPELIRSTGWVIP